MSIARRRNAAKEQVNGAVVVEILGKQPDFARKPTCLIRHPRELCALLELTGLASVLCVEPEGQPEEREQRLHVEEEGELADPPA